jgi:hypothetical protein
MVGLSRRVSASRLLTAVAAAVVLWPSVVGAQRCDCTTAADACCAAWEARTFQVSGTVTRDALTLGDAALPEPAEATDGPPVTRPRALPVDGLLPRWILALPEDHERVGSFVGPYRELVALDGRSDPASTGRARDLERQLVIGLGESGGDSAERWLLIGDLRRRVAQRAFAVLRGRHRACRAGATPEACGVEPRLNREYARTAFEEAARVGAGTTAGVEGVLLFAESLLGGPRNARALQIFERLTEADDARLAERAQVLTTAAQAAAGDGRSALRAIASLDREIYGAFAAYARLALDAGADAATVRREALAVLEAPGVREVYLRNAASFAAAATAEAGDLGSDAFDDAPAGLRPILHAAMAAVLWDAGARDDAIAHARRGLRALTGEERAAWEARLPEDVERVEPPPEEPVAPPAPPAEEAGMLAWLTYQTRTCLAEAAEQGLGPTRVSWTVQAQGARRVARAQPRPRGGPGVDTLVRCLERPQDLPVEPARLVTLRADLAFVP